MANKVSSAPLFGSPTRREVEAVVQHMRNFTQRVVKNPDKTRQLLEDIGAVSKGSADDTEPVV